MTLLFSHEEMTTQSDDEILRLIIARRRASQQQAQVAKAQAAQFSPSGISKLFVKAGGKALRLMTSPAH